MAAVVLKNLVKSYGATQIVKGINLEIKDKEFAVLVGPSGCGKSTTLRMIAGLEGISGGTVEIDGRTVNEVAPKDRDIAMVFQSYALYPHLNVYENIAFGLRIRKLPPAQIDEKVRKASAILDLNHLLERKPKELSGGQRQRVAMGRAIVREPKLFLFDEPLSNLDAKLRGVMRNEIQRLSRQLQTTMVYVTHDQVEAMTLADRIIILNEGIIQQNGTPLEVYNKPANLFVAGFIGQPPMNIIPGEIIAAGTGRFFLSEDKSLRVSLAAIKSKSIAAHTGKKVKMGIRPTHIQDAKFAGAFGRNAHPIAITVDIIEQLGSEITLQGKSGDYDITAIVNPLAKVAHGARVKLMLDTAQIHLFDAETTRAIH